MTVVQPPAQKTIEVTVVVPVEDMTRLDEPTGEVHGSAAGAERRASIWPAVEERVLDLIEQHRSTIVFANSRRLAERLCARLNELADERRYGQTAQDLSGYDALDGGDSGVGAALPDRRTAAPRHGPAAGRPGRGSPAGCRPR